MCRARVYARGKAVEWIELGRLSEVPNVTWQEALASVERLVVGTDRGATVPAGIELRIEQFVATRSGRLGDFDSYVAYAPYVSADDPLQLVDGIGRERIEGSDEYLFRVEYDYETYLSAPYAYAGAIDLAGLIDPEINSIGPIATIDQSFENDDELYAITLATLEVPLDDLDGTETTFSVDVRESLAITARAGL